ncbi:hypothetical protein M422DRAFT_220565 [Sphaerobolus stellatus SS14]|nr:hypothetical protein M422DRAFT_220565 [Sphaerobolus stellatus SS14]
MTDNKRTAAYENIFGRPSTQHHQPQPPAPPNLQYPQSQPYRPPTVQPQQQYYPYHQQYQQQHYYARYQDPRRSYAPSVSSQHTQQYPGQPQPYRNQLAPPLEGRLLAGSVASVQGIITPQPEPPLDPGLEALTRQGLTPAQAYQAQVYQNEQAPPPGWNPYNNGSPLSPPNSGTPVNNVQTHYREPLPALETDTGSLGINFPGDDGQEDSSLPYMTEEPGKSVPLHLSLSTASSSSHSIPTISSPDSSTALVDVISPRLSSESVPTLPRPKGARAQRTVQDRSKSMSATTNQAKAMLSQARNSHPVPSLPSPMGTPSSTQHRPGRGRRTPIVNPALLSKVAEAFHARVTLSDRVKDGLTYKDSFDGREAVDKIAYIIKTTDRCLALLLGRALDAQKFFHDVTYDHRLRDSAHEIYRFRQRIPSPFTSGDEIAGAATANGNGRTSTGRDSGAESTLTEGINKILDGGETTPRTPEDRDADALEEEDEFPTGVFTLLTDCYSPTCSRDRLCYSISCPRRLEQQAKLNLKQEPGLKRTISRESLGDFVEPGTLWVHSVPKEIVDSVSDMEKKRQEAINEVIYTERDFVRDMEYLRDFWIKRLQKSDVIPQERRQEFLSQVFWNIYDIISVNTRLRDALNKRQKSYAVVEKIGDICMDAFPHFGPFVNYGAHQLYGKYEFEKEKSANPAFAQFVEETERLPEGRKLELNGYLTKPTTRLARYPLLLQVVLKYTSDDNPDKLVLPQAIKIIRGFLEKVNIESGKTENRFNLLQLNQHLVFRAGESMDLKLQEEGRELLYKGTLRRRGQSDNADLQVFLFDHALLMVKQKGKHEQHKVYRRPIPLGLLVVSAQDDTTITRPHTSRGKNTLMKAAPEAKGGDSKNGYPITFVHLGRHSYQLTLWASTWVARKKWVENIQKQQEKIREATNVFEAYTLSEGFFSAGAANRVNCAAPFNNGRRLAFGTADGVYFSDLREPHREPVKVVGLMAIEQLDVLDEYQLLIVLSDRAVITFPLDALDPRDPSAGLKRAKRVSAHTTFFKVGVCLDRTLVCIVKTSPLSSTVKVLEPIDYNARAKHKPTFRKILQGGNDTLRAFKEFYIPVESSSLHYLRTKLCVGCERGFEIIDLETLDTQDILHPDDKSLEFVQKNDTPVRPMAIYRIGPDFLLCYDEYAFYINRNGFRKRPEFMINWEGYPTAFALHYPYLLAFEPNFVEIRHVETGQLSQIIQGNNLRCLYAYTPPSQSSTHAASHNSYPSSGYSQSHHPSASYGDRSSMYSQFGAPQPGVNGAGYVNTLPHKIIMVSDDSVVSLRPAVPADPIWIGA